MDADPYAYLLNSALRYLSFRERSEKEMREYLAKKAAKIDAPSDVVQNVFDRLKELQFIGDEKFAAWWIEQRTGHKPKGSQVIKQELRQKGVSADITEATLGSETSPETELEAAKRAIVRKLPVWSRYPLLEQKQKLYAFLARRGFPSAVIARTIDWATQKDYNTEAQAGE